MYLIQESRQEWNHEIFFVAASWINLHRLLRGPFRLVQEIMPSFQGSLRSSLKGPALHRNQMRQQKRPRDEMASRVYLALREI